MTRFQFDNSYARLPERFFARVSPTPVAAPRLIRLNVPLAVELGLDPAELAGEKGAEIFSGNRLPEDADPIATAYAGILLRPPMPDINSVRSCRSWVMAGPCC
jgi:serine/tyrosine/threonine adenylyltransferase